MKRIFFIPFTIVFLLFFCSCNHNLSRDEAEKIIKAQYPVKQNSEFKLTTADEGNIWAVSSYQTLEKAGLVTLVKWQEQNFMGYTHVRSIPTAEGRKYLQDTVNSNSGCVLSIQEFVEITGISQEQPNKALVKYTSQYFPTPLAHILIIGSPPPAAGTVYENTVTLTKFDDGWRIDGMQNKTANNGDGTKPSGLHVSKDAIVIICILAFCIFILFLYRAIRRKQKDKTRVAESDMAKSSVSYGTRLILRDVSVVVGILLLGGGIFCGYWFFFRHDPASDAKKAVHMVCDCTATDSERRVKKLKNLISSFDTYKFKRQSEAREKVQSMLVPDDTTQACLTRENSARMDLRTNYISDPEKLKQFDAAFAQLANVCDDPHTLQLNELQNEVEKKIATLTDPEPGEQEIKNALLGKAIPGWRFDGFLPNSREFHIDSTDRVGNRIEYLITMLLQGDQSQTYQRNKVVVTYEKEEQGWYFLNVKALIISYRNRASVNQWEQVTTLPNCTLAIDGYGQRFWIRDGLYGQQQMSGPDAPGAIEINTNEVYIMSREDHDIDIDFIYLPKQ